MQNLLIIENQQLLKVLIPSFFNMLLNISLLIIQWEMEKITLFCIYNTKVFFLSFFLLFLFSLLFYPFFRTNKNLKYYSIIKGHSRTIIGFEQLKNNNINLIILDPSTKKEQLDRAILNQDLRTFRYSLNRLKNKQYQIVKVVGVYKTIEEREESKNLSSISYP